MYANKLKIPTDGNELTLVEVIAAKGKENKKIRYQYTKSLSKKGEYLDMTEKEYEDFIRKNIFKDE